MVPVRPVDTLSATAVALVLGAGAHLFLQRARAGLVREWSAQLAVGAGAAATRLAGWRRQQLDEIQTLARLATGHAIQIEDDLRIVPPRDSIAGRRPTLTVESIDSSSVRVLVTAPLVTGQVLERTVRLGTEFWRSLPRPPIDPTGQPYRTAIAEAGFRSGTRTTVIAAAGGDPTPRYTARSFAANEAPDHWPTSFPHGTDTASVDVRPDAIWALARGDSAVVAVMSIATDEALRDLVRMRRITWAGTVGAFVLVATLVIAVRSAREAERRRRLADAARRDAETLLATAQLDALRGQLQPHFLFNTLNTIVGLADTDPASTRRVVEALSELLRSSLDLETELEVSVAAELELLTPYLDIQTIRFGERLRITIAAAPDTLDALMPRLSMQPLVENAIRHGLGPRSRAGSVHISVQRDGDDLVLAVLDDGAGLPAGRLREGVGLGNTRARLAGLYGEAASLTIANRPGGGAIVTVRLPFRRSAIAAPRVATSA